MMLAFLQLVAIAFVVMTVFYLLISIYSRSVRRERLERRWVEEGGTGDRRAYVEDGLRKYDASIRPKLVLLVFVVPTVAIAVVFYLVNFT